MRNTTLCIDLIEKCGILGVSQVVAQIADSSVVIHGHKGCVYTAYEASINYPLNINYTEMCEKSTVFGGEHDVSEKIADEFYENRPDVMAVVTTCSSEIIGDDIDGVIMLADLPIPVIRIDGGGFLNTQTSGMNMAMKALVGSLCKDGDNSCPVVNLFSPICINSSWQEDMQYLTDLLKEFGIAGRPLFCNTNVEDIRDYSHASLNVVICSTIGVDAAKSMSQEDIKSITNEQVVEESSAKDSANEQNEGCAGDCCCNLFSYKRPTEEDAKKNEEKKLLLIVT